MPRRSTIGTTAVAVLVLSLASWRGLAQGDPIDVFVGEQLKAFGLPGLSLAIVQDGKVVRAGGYGLADPSRGTPAAATTVYKIASVSKQFVATAIMLLAQDGKLQVDDPVSRYLEGTPSAWQPITIRHLMTHTAGLPRESPAFDPMKATSDAEIVKATYAMPLRFMPGSKWEYSNVGYYALAEIVTRVAGQPWTRFIQDRIFTPAAMTVTAPTNVTPTLPNRARGYGGTDNRQPADEWVALRASGAFLSTVEDLAKWDALLYTDKILTEASRRQMWAPVQLTGGATHPYGFGWHTLTQSDGRRVVWHGGGLPGFASYFGRHLDDRITVIVLTNGNDVDIAAVANGIADRYAKSRTVLPR